MGQSPQYRYFSLTCNIVIHFKLLIILHFYISCLPISSSKKTLVGRHQGLDGEATGGLYSYGRRQGSVENDGARLSVQGPRPSEIRRGLGKARFTYELYHWAYCFRSRF